MVHSVAHAVLQHAIDEDWSRFDLAAYCYDVLLHSVASEETFLAAYCMDGGNGRDNPNLPLLRKTKTKWAEALAGKDGRLIDSARAYATLQSDLGDLFLEPFQDDSCNELTLVWLLVQAIDESCMESGRLRSDHLEFPLNQMNQDKAGVYFTSYTGFISEHFASSSIAQIPTITFNGQLDNLLFFRSQHGMAYPNLVVVRQDSRPTGALVAEGKPHEVDAWRADIRIGLEQFSGAHIADWDGAGTPLSFKNTVGQSFVAAYSDDYAGIFGDLVRESIDHAISVGCDVLVFPEYVMPVGLSDAVSTHLRSLADHGSLKLVIAGSGWVDGSITEGGDNVSRLFNGSGEWLGDVYKQDSYVGKQVVDGVSYRRVELLAHPGKEITVVDVPGLGRVVTAICRDMVSDKRTPLDFARDIRANLVCVPSLSASLDRGFKAHLNLLSERNLSVGCVCNLCSSRRVHEGDASVEVSLVGYPGASSGNPRQPEPKLKATVKTVECADECNRLYHSGMPQSCLWVATVTGESEDTKKSELDVRVERFANTA